jgi:hypothetical protein
MLKKGQKNIKWLIMNLFLCVFSKKQLNMSQFLQKFIKINFFKMFIRKKEIKLIF